MNGFKIVLLGILFITITITTIPLLVNEESMAQTSGVTPIDPENVTNQPLQDYSSEDKNMSTGIENE